MATTTPIQTAGSTEGLNRITGLTAILSANQTELASEDLNNTTHPVTDAARVLCYNTDSKQLMVSDNILTGKFKFADHEHPAYAPAIHSHQAGGNTPWLMSNPQLWYRGDLQNHPELIPLDGSIIPEGQYGHLDEVYDGEVVFTTFPDEFDGNHYNEDLRLIASNQTPQGYANNLFGHALTNADITNATDQWLTSSPDIHAEQYFIVELTNGKSYRPGCYVMYPAAGTPVEPLVQRPTPKHWIIEGVPAEATDDAWETIDEKTDVTDWLVFRAKTYRIEGNDKCYRKFKVTIKEWNAGKDSTYNTGLRRFWMQGRRGGMFALPNIPSPHPDFVWVVPRDTLSVGLKHEDIGDIGASSLRGDLLPKYRLPADGSCLSRDQYPMLRNCIGGRNDPVAGATVAYTPTSTVPEGGNWVGPSTTSEIAAEFTLTTAGVVSSYSFNTSKNGAKAMAWSLQAYTPEGAWVPVHTVTSGSYTPEEDDTGVHYRCHLDLAETEAEYTKYRLLITSLSGHTEDTTTISEVKLFTHPKDKFYLPTYRDSNDSVTTYVVADIPTVDVSASIISALQVNVAKLQAAHQQLQNEVNSFHPPVIS